MRGVLVAAASMLSLVSTSAWASPGCDAVNAGGLNQNASFGGFSRTVNAQFAAGDRLTVFVAPDGTPSVAGGGFFEFQLGAQLVRRTGVPGNPFDLGGFTADLVANGTETTARVATLAVAADTPTPITVTCIAAQAGNVPKMKQPAVLVAQTTGNVIAGAIGASVTEAFANPCDLTTPLPDGVRINITGWRDRDPACFDDNNRRPTSSYASDPDDASNAYARTKKRKATDAFLAFDKKPLARQPQDWRVWAEVRGAQWTSSPNLGGFNGGQINTLMGLTRRITSNFVAGMYAGYETFRFTSDTIAGHLKGDGWTVGHYIGWRIAQGVRFDAGYGYSRIGYDLAAALNPGFIATGNFSGDRWMVTAGLTGDYVWRAFTFEPSLRAYWLNEHENAFVDSTGALQAARTFTTGRASAGSKVIFPTKTTSKIAFAPYVGMYGDYYFTSDDLFTVITPNGPGALTVRGVSARATGGLTARLNNGTQLMAGGEYGGIGSGLGVWTYKARAAIPF